jgi:hypothetical protein
MIVSLDILRPSARHPSSYVVLLDAHDLLPHDTRIARFAARSQSSTLSVLRSFTQELPAN